MSGKHWIGVGASITLGLIFIVAGVGKLLHQPEAVRIFFIPLPDFLTATLTKAVFSWLLYIELTVGLLLIIGVAPKLVATLSSALIAGFIAHNGLLISYGLWAEPCDCFRQAENSTLYRALNHRFTVFGYSNAGFSLNHIVLTSEQFLQYLSLVLGERVKCKLL